MPKPIVVDAPWRLSKRRQAERYKERRYQQILKSRRRMLDAHDRYWSGAIQYIDPTKRKRGL